MTKNVFSMYRYLAVLLALWLVLAPAVSAAVDRVAVPADPCGPGVALKSAGYSYRLVPQLQHEDGSPLLPSEVRTAPDKVFYLPVNARPSSAQYAEFISAENAKFGASQGPCIAKGPGCKELLLAANKRAEQFKVALDAANKRADKAEASVVNLTKKLEDSAAALKASQDNEGISPWWLILLLFIPAVWYVMRWRLLQVEEERNSLRRRLSEMPTYITETARQRDAANEQVKSLQKNLQQEAGHSHALQEQVDVMTAQWNDPELVSARADELDAPTEPQSSPKRTQGDRQ